MQTMLANKCLSRCPHGQPCLSLKQSFGAARRPVALRQRPRRSAIAALDPDNASILVAGGGGVGLDVVRQLKDAGAWVWMLQRNDARRPDIEQMMAVWVKGDAMDRESVKKAFDGIEEIDAVVSTIGGTPADPTVDSQGNINLIEEAAARGVKRFVLVTSIGTGDSSEAPPRPVYDVLKPVLVEKGKAEDRLKEFGDKMEYVIVRPGGLKSEPGTGQGVLTEDKTICGAINRDDVAALVVKCVFSDKATNKVLSAVATDQLMKSGSQTVDEFVV